MLSSIFVTIIVIMVIYCVVSDQTIKKLLVYKLYGKRVYFDMFPDV